MVRNGVMLSDMKGFIWSLLLVVYIHFPENINA